MASQHHLCCTGFGDRMLCRMLRTSRRSPEPPKAVGVVLLSLHFATAREHVYSMGTVGTLLVFSLLMVALPLSAFFSTWNGRLDGLLQPILGPQLLQDHRLVVAAVLSVLGVSGSARAHDVIV
jgi:hypothetical protein